MRMRMHGWRAGEEEDHQRKRHMWTVPPRGSPILDALAHGAATASYSPNSTTFFSKDGRKISVGDCALFLPPKDSPPFIGIIRSVTVGKENKLTLSVNWLYRPAEVKLGKRFPLEAAPNEIFYSFHKDEIPAASLLHPCKVAFLPKGVELPSGIVSFVCRKVYDITKQCLWWLTDKDYMTDRQEEIDQLLHKTRVEMHATVPPGGRSPKPMNGPTSTSQSKHGSDSVQNSASSYPSQVKGKKRERGDQVSEPVKRERSSRMEDGDSGHNRTDSLKSEIAKFTDKGGLVDYDGVEKLVQLMIPEKKIDLVCRSMLAGVVAATDNNDCLNWFVQLKGLPVYDEWLQEVHKGKIGDGSSPKDSDKSVEEFLLTLLRALDKLPINLHALQMCNIGKSVNHLRTHKNLEIQKKARSLVDTWKKRVEAEMDAKPNQAVSWSARPRLPEATPGGNRQSGGFSEVSVKSLVMQPTASKTSSVKLVPGETAMKSAFASQVSVKSTTSPTSVGSNLKDGQSRNSASGGATDLPSTPAKDEKSSSAGQSHNNTHSCSIDHTKTGGCSGKEDVRSSTAASVTTNKASGSSRSRKSVNGFPCSNLSGVQRETGSNRTSQHRNQASERPYHSSLTSDKAIDVSAVEGSNHKLIVKIPNRGRSPAQSASAGSLEDPLVTNSIASSPILSEKQDQFDRNLKEKNDTLLGVDEGDGAPSVAPESSGCQTDDDTKAFTEISKDASLSSGNEHKNTKRQQIPFSALVKYSAVAASVPVGDDIGMNLLASVAAGEMCKSDVVSPDVSPRRNTPVHEQLCDDKDSRVKSSPGVNLSPEQSQSIDGADDEHGKQVDRTLPAKNADTNLEKSARDLTGQINISPVDLPQTRNAFQERSENLKQDINEEISDATAKYLEGKAGSRVDTDGSPGAKQKISSSLLTVDRVSEPVVKVETEALEVSQSYRSSEIDGETKKNVNDGFNNDIQTEQKLSTVVKQFDFVKGTDAKMLHTSGPGKDMASENVDEVKADNADEVDVTSHLSDGEKQKTEWRTKVPLTHSDQNEPNSGLDVSDHKCEHIEETVESNEGKKHHCAGPASPEVPPALQVQETGQHGRLGVPKLTGDEVDEAEVSSSTTADVSFSTGGVTDMEAKVEFDLNENFSGDDGKYGELNHLTAPDCSGTAQQLISPLPFPVSSVSSSLLASITVAAAAKGPFVPPEDLLRSKGALGWKGSAATSAFRPAEPRKALEIPLGETNISLSNATPGKHSRPPLDIDLNVPDERIFEDLVSRGSTQDTFCVSGLTNNRDVSHERIGSTPARCSGGLDLDLNRVEELTDGNISTSNGHKADIPVQPVTSSSGGLFNGEVSVRRDFDLNDGPVVDEMSTDPALFNQNTRSIPPQPPVSVLRMNTADTGNLASWYPRGNTYSTVTVPSLPDREQQPFSIVAPGAHQRMLTPPSVGTSFVPDVFRGPVLSSSPAVPFPSTHFQYSIFPFGTTFPLPSATFSGGSTAYVDSSSGGRLCFPAMNSQILGPTPAVPSHYPRPYVVSLPDGSNNSNAESGWKWGRQALDLNAGPGVPDIEGRDETLPLVPRQLSVASSQALAEEQARIYMPGGILKRKEPEGWDGYKRPSWQY
ncbi:uncharacterized protein LOC123204262 isoform X1 [Mangifera indica]|uniref:uncharacterized protein LOC123204262 isoform X1 n=1 Tax=Mangifera indica TaxID=29780 RepID=UPI001CFB6E58|nr:uncharacterized protein LOC123204262 isoform X1 [Mangifera indica]XP_044476800.1 uncharacterized protein LOC123204262 isoform X1 [Mangifera indica]